MKLKYNGNGNLKTKGILFEPNAGIYEVVDADGRYLLSTFDELFIEIEEPKKVEPKVEVKKPVVDKKKAE